MKKLLLIIFTLALMGCSSAPLKKADLSYKVFPKIANFKYDFKLAIPKTTDARNSKFIFNHDNYFANDVSESFEQVLYEEIKSTNAFQAVSLVDSKIGFNPTASNIQNIMRSYGKDVILLTQINKFNSSIRNLSDQDTSNYVNLKIFANITYKMILANSETIIFLTTKDTSIDKVVLKNKDIFRSINELTIQAIKENITAAKNEFILTTKNNFSLSTTTKNNKEETTIKPKLTNKQKGTLKND